MLRLTVEAKTNEKGVLNQTTTRGIKHEIMDRLLEKLADYEAVHTEDGIAFQVQVDDDLDYVVAIVINPVVKLDYDVEYEAEAFLEIAKEKENKKHEKEIAKAKKVAEAEARRKQREEEKAAKLHKEAAEVADENETEEQ